MCANTHGFWKSYTYGITVNNGVRDMISANASLCTTGSVGVRVCLCEFVRSSHMCVPSRFGRIYITDVPFSLSEVLCTRRVPTRLHQLVTHMMEMIHVQSSNVVWCWQTVRIVYPFTNITGVQSSHPDGADA